MRDLPPYDNERTAPATWQAAQPSSRAVAEDEVVHLRDHWRVGRKPLWLVVLTLFSTILIVVLGLLAKTPIYTGSASLLI
jgi:uncharacterized protein involved in exopolysaccharide biosynthesis